MIEDKTLMIARILDTGSAFGHVMNTGESAFIPQAVVTASRICEGEVVSCKVKENIRQADTVPWFVISIHRDDFRPQEDFADLGHVQSEISALGMVTAEEIAESIGSNKRAVTAACNQLFTDGRIVKLVAYDGPESGPVKTYYVESIEDLG